jgi:predicted phosphodiesterase
VASGPGRACPASYGYGARAFDRRPELEVETLWVAGGLYGNPFALERLIELYEREPGSKALVFNGDFHWFDVEENQFRKIDEGVKPFLATRGNVETELASPAEGAGCGCGYPDWVDDGTVSRSNSILEKLRATASRVPEARAALARLPMHLVAEVGGVRVGVVHGDADSLAGWGFSQETLATAPGAEAARRAFEQARVRVFASSHTCLPVLQEVRGGGLVANNGAAGMPNFSGTRYGLATRISVSPLDKSLYSKRAKHLHVEAVALDYDHAAWERCFLAQWPAGSEAHRSYYERIVHGPRYGLDQALRGTALAA